MKNLLIIMCVVVVTVCAFACGNSPVDASISKVEKALEKLEKGKKVLTTADWEAFVKEIEPPMKVLNDALESDDVGHITKLKIAALAAKVTVAFSEVTVGELEKETGLKREEFGKEADKFLKELEKTVNKTDK